MPLPLELVVHFFMPMPTTLASVNNPYTCCAGLREVNVKVSHRGSVALLNQRALRDYQVADVALHMHHKQQLVVFETGM